MDENGVLVRLASSENGLKEPEDATDLIYTAKAAGLSVPTIQKAISQGRPSRVYEITLKKNARS